MILANICGQENVLYAIHGTEELELADAIEDTVRTLPVCLDGSQ